MLLSLCITNTVKGGTRKRGMTEGTEGEGLTTGDTLPDQAANLV